MKNQIEKYASKAIHMEENFECRECDIGFKSRYHLENHTRLISIESQPKKIDVGVGVVIGAVFVVVVILVVDTRYIPLKFG